MCDSTYARESDPHIPGHHQADIDSVDAASLARACLRDLSGVFMAIKKLSEEHTTIHTLAGIGLYLADDWANLVCEELNAELDSLRSVKNEATA